MNKQFLEITANILKCSVAQLEKTEEKITLPSIGFTSLNYLKCLFELEDAFQIRFDERKSLFINVKTWGEFCNLVESTL